MSSKKSSVTKGFSIPQGLLDRVLAMAKSEDRSFSFIVRRALRREVEGELLTPKSEATDELMTTEAVARVLKCSVFTVRRRAGTPGDPLFDARSRIGCQKPMHFRRSKLVEIDRRFEN